MQDNKTKLIGLVVIALLAVGGTGGVVVLNSQEKSRPAGNTTSSKQSTSSTTPNSSSTSTTATSEQYKDGEYSADGKYRSPGGNETVHVTLTLKDNTVQAVKVSGDGTGESAEYQAMFSDGISAQVVGKKIDELNISRVSGSSLTSTGFNNALATIKQDAQA